jgi:DNA-binding transcriptional ArsR family regulator
VRELNLWHTVSTATISSHLDKLYRREILHVEDEKNGKTYYSLEKTFKAVLESEMERDPLFTRNHYTTSYLENAFSKFDRYTKRSRKKVSWQLGRRRKSK